MCLACGSAWRVDPRVARAQVHLPAGAVRPRPFVSVSPLRRGSFALGTGRSPMSKPHVPCMWKSLAGRPTGGAGPSPPTSKRCEAPSFGIGQSLAPWIIRPRYGPQPDEQAACALCSKRCVARGVEHAEIGLAHVCVMCSAAYGSLDAAAARGPRG